MLTDLLKWTTCLTRHLLFYPHNYIYIYTP